MANGNVTIIVGSSRQEHSAVFSVCQVLFYTIYIKPVAGDRAHYALSPVFLRLPEGRWFDIEALIKTGKFIFSG